MLAGGSGGGWLESSPSIFVVAAGAPTPGKESTLSFFGNVGAPLGALDVVAALLAEAGVVAVADGLASATDWFASTPARFAGSANAPTPGKESTVSFFSSVEAPVEARGLVLELARRYITLYAIITWKDFDFHASGEEEITKIIKQHLEE